jgi:HK97 family phage major capsid protein
MNLQEKRARLEELRAQITDLSERETLDDDGIIALDLAVDEAEQLLGEIRVDEAREARIVEIRAYANAGNTTSGDATRDADPLGTDADTTRRGTRNPWDYDAVRALSMGDPDRAIPEMRSRALDAVAQSRGLSDVHRQAATALIERLDPEDIDQSTGTVRVLRHIIAVSDPVYARAFGRWMRAGLSGRSDPDAAQILARAMSLTDAAGGYAVPLPIDPTLILTSDGSANPFRQIGRVVPVVTDQYRTVNTTHASFSWDAEAAEVSDDATTFANIDITVHKAQGFIPFSIEIGQDYPNFTEDVGRIIAGGKDDLEATAFATGSGSGQPFGIVTALDGTSSEITSATTDTFAIADVYSTIEALGPRFRMGASWVSNLNILNDIRQFGTANNYHGFTVDLTAEGVPAILGKRWYESSAMDGTINALADNNILVCGDFSNYVIADRVGLSIELVPHLLHTSNNRPSGQRGFYCYWRAGADSVNDAAFTLLNVT